MPEWRTYLPSDFLLFRPEAYWHLFEIGNRIYWPLIPGRSLWQSEFPSIAPDPTAMATLGLALMLRWGIVLAVLPSFWLAVGAATLLTLDQT